MSTFIFKAQALSEEIQGFEAEILCPKTAAKKKKNTKNKNQPDTHSICLLLCT